jgi:hypothetical protein
MSFRISTAIIGRARAPIPRSSVRLGDGTPGSSVSRTKVIGRGMEYHCRRSSAEPFGETVPDRGGRTGRDRPEGEGGQAALRNGQRAQRSATA